VRGCYYCVKSKCAGHSGLKSLEEKVDIKCSADISFGLELSLPGNNVFNIIKERLMKTLNTFRIWTVAILVVVAPLRSRVG